MQIRAGGADRCCLLATAPHASWARRGTARDDDWVSGLVVITPAQAMGEARPAGTPLRRQALRGRARTIPRPDTTVNESGLNTNLPIGNGADATATMEPSAEGCTTKTQPQGPTIPFNSLTRESTALHEELKALEIVLLALQRLGQPTAIQQPIPSTSLCVPSLAASSLETSRRLPCRVLAGVTAGAAVSTYGV
jgi:hypothetical protein